MFTQKELKEIAAAHKAVFEAIRPGFGSDGSTRHIDQRAAEQAAGQIVAAKIIADGNGNGNGTKLGATCRACTL